MQTLGELKSIAAGLVQRKADTTFQNNLIKPWINLSLQLLYNRYDYFDELKRQHDFTSVKSTVLYFMPSDFEKANRIYDITNNRKINVSVEESYFDGNIVNIADATEGEVNTMYFKEVVGVKVQVSTSGDNVQAKSSSASDTSVVIRVEGYIDSDLTIVGYENITVTGTTAVAGTTTFFKILHLSKAADTTGFITLEDSSAVDLGILAPIDRVARYKAFRLGLIPDDSVTNYRVLYKKKFPKLVDDEDYPFVDCDDYLIFNTVSLALQRDKESVQRAVMMQSLASEAVEGILLNQATKLGTSYQHRITSGILSSHRA